MNNYSNKPFPSSVPDHSTEADNELSLLDMIAFLKAGWKWIVLGCGVGAIAGLTYAFFAPEKFSATAYIQMATVTKDPVEAPATLAERLKMPLFYSSAVHSACGLSGEARPGEILAKSLKPSVNRSAPMVSISFERGSAELAAQCLNAVIDRVREQQSALAEPIISGKSAQLVALRKRLLEAEALERDFGAKRLAAISAKGNDTQAATLLSALTSNDLAIKGLITEISELELSLRAPQTQPTSLATSIYTREVLTPSKRALIAVAAMLGGAFLGLGVLMLRNAWITEKNQSLANSVESFGFELKGKQFVLRNTQRSEEREST